jgi:glycerophosphoryl diester phosphodiesterase
MFILGHRGANWQQGEFQENTMEAFEQALSIGAHGIETDVRLHNDIPVLQHDPIHIGDKRGLTLETLLDWAPDDFLLNLEIKDPDAMPSMIKLMNQYDKRYLVTSFWHRTVWQFSKEAPNVDCGPIVSFSPIFVTVLKSLIPSSFSHIVWDCTIMEDSVIQRFDKYKHFVYNAGHYTIEGVDGIISDNLNIHLNESLQI